MFRPKFVYTLAILAMLIAISTTVWLLWIRESVSEWKIRLLDQSVMVAPTKAVPLPAYTSRLVYLKNDLQRREFWGESEVSEVIEMLDGVPLDFVPTEATSKEEWGEYFLAGDVQVAIRVRLRIGAPIAPTQRARIINALLDRSHAASMDIRASLAEAFCWSGLIFEDERVDKRVHEMMDDPEPRVAANARSQYRFHSEGRAKWAEYQRRQGRDIPSDGG